MRKFSCLLISLLLVFSFVSSASAVELISNGGFETGDFTDWYVEYWPESSGSWFVDDNDLLTPLSGHPTVGPASGDFYAVSDEEGPTSTVLIQGFEVPVGYSSVVLSFDMFINDWSYEGPIVADAEVYGTELYVWDPISGDDQEDNQHGRVDLLGDESAFDTVNALNLFKDAFHPISGGGPDSDEDEELIPNDWVHYSFDISAYVVGGEEYAIRFAQADTLWWFNMGIDNVSIEAVPEAVPEPATMLLLGGGFLGLAGFCRKKFFKK